MLFAGGMDKEGHCLKNSKFTLDNSDKFQKSVSHNDYN